MTGTLRDRIRFERRGVLTASDGRTWDDIEDKWLEDAETWDAGDAPGDAGGNTQGDFRQFGPTMRALVNELNGGESVVAAKLQGHSVCYVVVRSSRFTREITADDRIVQTLPGGVERVLNIRHAPPPGKGSTIAFLCEDGVA